MYVIGHRGAAGYCLENTMEGFLKAYEIGVDFIETDIQQTKDKKFVVFHDNLLDRITDHHGYISHYTKDELDKVILTNGEKIPSLEELCTFCCKNSLKVFLEIKNDSTAEEIEQIASQYLSIDQYIIGSFFHPQIEKLKQKKMEVQTCVIFEGVLCEIENYLSTLKSNYVSISIESCNDYLIDTIKFCGKKLIFWTVNVESDIKKFIGYNPVGIISNFPDRIIRGYEDLLLSC
jgi:glycerophosphoryl diester phosphodiesterase